MILVVEVELLGVCLYVYVGIVLEAWQVPEDVIGVDAVDELLSNEDLSAFVVVSVNI